MTPDDAPPLYLLDRDLPWWPSAWRSRRAAETSATEPVSRPADPAEPTADRARAELVRALVRAGAADPETAVADALLFGAASAWQRATAAPGVRRALVADVRRVVRTFAVLRTADAAAEARADVVPLRQLAPEDDVDGATQELRARILRGDDPEALVDHVVEWRARHGGGSLGRYRAFRWQDGRIVGVARPARPRLERMADLDRQIEVLERNTEAFLSGRPAMHALLYGPRGSGKSTVVRALLTRYGEQGLRLIELPAHALSELPEVLTRLHDRPERFVVFVDDLSFEAGDARYHPLKTLLEGSIEARPDHVRLYATSNRRHLVQERLRDRPDPLDDDVHAWDTQNERLALADRFGLLVTFPSADRKRYLAIVRHVAERDGLVLADHDDLEARADRFAGAGNGYSGRTAQQFVDAVRAGLA